MHCCWWRFVFTRDNHSQCPRDGRRKKVMKFITFALFHQQSQPKMSRRQRSDATASFRKTTSWAGSDEGSTAEWNDDGQNACKLSQVVLSEIGIFDYNFPEPHPGIRWNRIPCLSRFLCNSWTCKLHPAIFMESRSYSFHLMMWLSGIFNYENLRWKACGGSYKGSIFCTYRNMWRRLEETVWTTYGVRK